MGPVRQEGSSAGACCDGCPLVERRAFVRDATLVVAGLFVRARGGSARDDKRYAIPAEDGAQIDRENGTILMRWQGKVYVFALTCPHQNTALKWYDKENQFECPKHHSRFQPDGNYIKDSGRATRGLDRFAVRKDGANIVANLDKLYQEDDNEAEWKAAFITV